MTLKNLALAAAAFAAILPAANAGTINTIISNFDIGFDGGTGGGQLTDFNNPLGGNLSITESRQFTSLEVEVDGVSVATLMNTAPSTADNLYGDLRVPNLGTSLTANTLVMNAGGTGGNAFGFDFFDGQPGGFGLELEFDSINYTLVSFAIPGFPPLSFFNWFAQATVVSQNLPGGVEYGENVLVSFTATEVTVNAGRNMLVASGAMTITGNDAVAIPEPTSLALASLVGLSGCFRRR